MNCFCSLELCDRGFESHSRYGCFYCVRLFCVCVVLCVGRGLGRADLLSKESFRLCIWFRKLKKRPRPNKELYSHNSIQFSSILSIHFFIIVYVANQQIQDHLQTQHSVDTSNYIMDKHNKQSKTNYRQTLEEKHSNAEK
jgi:hypothetical protein